MSNRQDRWSLVIFIHLFCVAVGLFGRDSNAELATRLTRVLGPYLRLVNINPQTPTGFHLTHGMEYEDDHLFIIRDGQGGDVQQRVWPDVSRAGFDPFGFRRQRWLNLGSSFSVLIESGEDGATAELARAVASRYFASSDTSSRRIEFQCRRLSPMERDATRPEPEPALVIYTADVWIDDSGIVRVQKRVPEGEAAPVTRNSETPGVQESDSQASPASGPSSIAVPANETVVQP